MPEKSYLPKARQKLTPPEKPNTCASTFVSTFSGRFYLSLEATNFIFHDRGNNLITAFIADKYINI